MHIEKNCFDNVWCTVFNHKGKTKDNLNSRHDLKKLEICLELHLVRVPGKAEPFKSKASHVLNAY